MKPPRIDPETARALQLDEAEQWGEHENTIQGYLIEIRVMMNLRRSAYIDILDTFVKRFEMLPSIEQAALIYRITALKRVCDEIKNAQEEALGVEPEVATAIIRLPEMITSLRAVREKTRKRNAQ